eukprot:7059069-Prymnesium_polylepis.1
MRKDERPNLHRFLHQYVLTDNKLSARYKETLQYRLEGKKTLQRVRRCLADSAADAGRLNPDDETDGQTVSAIESLGTSVPRVVAVEVVQKKFKEGLLPQHTPLIAFAPGVGEPLRSHGPLHSGGRTRTKTCRSHVPSRPRTGVNALPDDKGFGELEMQLRFAKPGKPT